MSETYRLADVERAFKDVNMWQITAEYSCTNMAKYINVNVKERVKRLGVDAGTVCNGALYTPLPHNSPLQAWIEFGDWLECDLYSMSRIVNMLKSFNMLEEWVQTPCDWGSTVTGDDVARLFMYSNFADFKAQQVAYLVPYVNTTTLANVNQHREMCESKHFCDTTLWSATKHVMQLAQLQFNIPHQRRLQTQFTF